MSDVYIPPGRPSRLTPERADKIVELIGQGHYNRTAALAVGVGYRTIQRWLARGEAADERLSSGQPINSEDERYWHFWHRVQLAESAAVGAALSAIRGAYEADARNWTAAAWYLERKYPGEWGRRQEVSVGPNDRMLEILATAITVGGEEDTQPGTQPGTTVTVAPDALEPPE